MKGDIDMGILYELVDAMENDRQSLTLHVDVAIGEPDKTAMELIKWIQSNISGDVTMKHLLKAIDHARFWLVLASGEAEAVRRAILAVVPNDVCHWSLEDDDWNAWKGSCGALWGLTDSTPEDNGMAYCPKCGRPLVTVIPDEEE